MTGKSHIVHSRPVRIWLALFVVGTTVPVGVWVKERLAPESSPVARGAAYATGKSCIECHGEPGADTYEGDCSNTNTKSWHPTYSTSCDDVMAYFAVLRLRRAFDERVMSARDNPLIVGEVLARKYHCFQCHGQLGQGGFANPGSLKGYVPGYFGDDFKYLTRNGDPGSVRAWIERGLDDHLVRQPVVGQLAEYFLGRQAVSMPRFESLQKAEVGVLVDYVIALHGFGPMTATAVQEYDNQSRAVAYEFRTADGGESSK